VKNRQIDKLISYYIQLLYSQILTKQYGKKRFRAVVQCELVNSLIPFWKRKHSYFVLEGE